MSDALYQTYQHYGTNAERLAFTPDPPADGQPLYDWYETDTGKSYVFDTTWHQLTGPALIPTVAQGDLLYGSAANTISTLTKDTNATRYLSNTGSSNNPAWAQVAISTGVSGLGTGVATALGTNVGSAGAPVVNGGALGTPSGGTLTSCTGLPLTTGVTGDLPLSSLAQASAASVLLGRGSAGGAGDYQEITVSTGLTMTGTTLTASGGSGTVTTSGSPANGNLTKFTGATAISNADLTGDVTTSGGVATTIANSAVTLAKIANASASSKLLGSGASGSGSAYAELTLGTNLSMSGTTLNAAGGSAGALILLEQHTASTSAALAFTTAITSTYDEYIFEIINLVNETNTVDLNVQVSTDGGSTYSSSGYEYVGVNNSTSNAGVSSTNSASAGAVQLWTGIDNSQSYGTSGRLTLYDPLNASLKKTMIFQVSSVLQVVARRYTSSGSGFWGSTTAVNAIKFLYSSGNITSGTIRCYGVAK